MPHDMFGDVFREQIMPAIYAAVAFHLVLGGMVANSLSLMGIVPVLIPLALVVPRLTKDMLASALQKQDPDKRSLSTVWHAIGFAMLIGPCGVLALATDRPSGEIVLSTGVFGLASLSVLVPMVVAMGLTGAACWLAEQEA